MILTLVTGADSRYFNYLIRVINNAKKIGDDKNIQIRIIVYNLGLTDSEIDTVRAHQFVTLEYFDFNKYPEHVSLKKYHSFNCTYAWKPIIIHEVCEKYGGLVYWMDTRSLYSDFSNLIKILQYNHIYTPKSGGTITMWTHPLCIKYMDGYKYINCSPRCAGIFGVNYDTDWVKDLVREWKDLALIKECICPTGSHRGNHRQDQAVLNILYYRYQEKYKFKNIDKYINMWPHIDDLNRTSL